MVSGHDHRSLRAQALRADDRGVLELGAPRAAVDVGLNCALGAAEMRPYIEELARVADPHVMRLSERRPAERIRRVRRDAGRDGRAPARVRADAGLVNIVGGCCGTTPEHIRAIAAGGRAACRRAPMPEIEPRTRGSPASKPLPSRANRHVISRFVNIGERTNVTGSAQVPQADHGRRLRRRGRRRARSRSRTARRSSTSTWTRACSTPSRRWSASST